MPVYEYRCPTCGGSSEEYRPVNDRAIPISCGCGEQQVLVPSVIDYRMKGRTRNINRIPMVPLKERMKAKYGDNP